MESDDIVEDGMRLPSLVDANAGISGFNILELLCYINK